MQRLLSLLAQTHKRHRGLTSMRAPYIRLAFCAGEVKAIAPQLLALAAQAASRNCACLGGLEP